jgi:hypothetical protein
MELMIIECKECGTAYKGDIMKPFLCPKCVAAGVKLPGMEEPKQKNNKPVLDKPESVPADASVNARLDNLESRIKAIEDLIKKMTE